MATEQPEAGSVPDICLVVAMARNRVIGRGLKLPWHLPGDLRHFRALTIGKPVIMGRRTWDSIGRPLPGRTNIVVTRNPEFGAEGARRCPDLDSALELARDVALIDGVDEIMVIGGAQLYALALPLADRIYLTEVLVDVDGDVLFPEFERSAWEVSDVREVLPAEGGGWHYRHATLRRVSAEGPGC